MDGFNSLPALVKGLALFAGLCVVGWFHFDRRNPDFNLTDLFMEGQRGSRKISGRKLYESGAFFLTSLWFASEIIRDKADLTDALAFAGLWAAVRTVGQAQHLRAGRDEQAST